MKKLVKSVLFLGMVAVMATSCKNEMTPHEKSVNQLMDMGMTNAQAENTMNKGALLISNSQMSK